MKIALKTVFWSCLMNNIFKNYIKEFIEYKRSNGYDYISEEWQLKNFEQYLLTHTTDIKLTKDIIHNFINNKKVKDSTKSKYASVIREFCRYLLLFHNLDIYIIDEKKYPRHYDFEPYIYSDAEIVNFFKAIDLLNNDIRKKDLRLIFEILYCTGLRISECLNIRISNIDFNNNSIKIVDTKNNLDRLIVISDNLMKKILKHNSNSEYLFINPYTSKPYTKTIISVQFLKILFKAKIKRCDNGPTIHSFRHTFAVKSFIKAINEKRNLNEFLPYLSTYLGHKSLGATEKYLRLIPSELSQIRSQIEMNGIIPDIEEDNEYEK